MRLVFMGTPEAAVTSLERLLADGHDVVAVYTQPDRPAGRGNKLIESPVKRAAAAGAIPVFQPVKLKLDESVETFRALKADGAIVVAYGRILPAPYLEAFPYGAINVHFSLLPKYRGAAPVNWAIVNGETITGVTTMKMDAGLDTGPILLQRETPIGEAESSAELMSRLAGLGADLLSDTLRHLPGIEACPQDDSQATLAPIMKKSDGLIDWTMRAEQIARRVRGFQPFPSSYSFFRGKRITIWKAVASGDSQADPGSIVETDSGVIGVAAGSGTLLEVHELQTEGKRRQPALDVINGLRPAPGERFSSEP